MSGPVEKWLESFSCSQYAQVLESYGIRTLQSVCHLQLPQLVSMGIPQKHCEIIHQNIHMLQQSTGFLQNHNSPHYVGNMSDNFNNMMPHGHGSMTTYQNQSDLSDSNMSDLERKGNCYGSGSYGYQRAALMSSPQFYNQSMSQHSTEHGSVHPAYRHQYQSSSLPYLHDSTGQVYMGPVYMAATMASSRQNCPGQFQGSSVSEQPNMRQSHPHLRNSGQTPQEVANNILHMATTNYPTNNTVQVPLCKNRPALYHMTQRSPPYNSHVQDMQHQMSTEYSQSHYMYDNSSPHLQQSLRDNGMSPASPVSNGMMPSPQSQQSSHSLQSSSPCSVRSPNLINVRSPGPEMIAPVAGRPQCNPYVMNSPQRGQQYRMPSPINTPKQVQTSPMPVNQQLQVSVPSLTPQSQQYGCSDNSYYISNQYHSPCTSVNHFSPTAHVSSPEGNSGHYSNISSLYTPGAKASYHASAHSGTDNSPSSQYFTDSSLLSEKGAHIGSNPLYSLQKLCMLPDKKVIDPKTVVHDSCVSYSKSEVPKNLAVDLPDSHAHSKASQMLTGNKCESISDASKDEAVISRDEKKNEITNHNKLDMDYSEEVRCQPKKMILLRAAKDELNNSMSLQNLSEQRQECDKPPRSDDSNTGTKNKSDSLEAVIDDTAVGHFEKLIENGGGTTKFDSKVKSSTGENEKCVNDKESETSDQSAVNDKSVECLVMNAVSCQEQSEQGNTSKNITAEISSDHSDSKDNKTVESQASDVHADYISDNSVSDSETNLVVRKDIKNTYSKHDRFSKVENNSRLRGDSTGSISEISEFEYEDHIGCDDIENNFSDIDDKSFDVIEETEIVTKPKKQKSNDSITDRVVISGPQWTKTHNVHNINGKRNLVSRQISVKNANSIIDGHIEIDTIPSPLSGDSVDGPVGVENGDGTVSVVRASRVRQRKTPIKYKDTSFFQGDFVFIEDEENYELQKKTTKKVLSLDLNHNAKKNGQHKILENVSSKMSAKQNKQKLNVESKPKEDIPVKIGDNDIKSDEYSHKDILLFQDTDSKTKTEEDTKVDSIINCVAKNCVKNEETQKITKNSKAKQSSSPESKSAILTRKGSKLDTSTNENKDVINDYTSNTINGFIMDSAHTHRNNVMMSDKNADCDNATRTLRNRNVKTKNEDLNKSEKKEIEESYDVIEIDSDDSDQTLVVDGAKKISEEATKETVDPEYVCTSLDMSCEDIPNDNACSSKDDRSKIYAFTLVEDEEIGEGSTDSKHFDLNVMSKQHSQTCATFHKSPVTSEVKMTSDGSTDSKHFDLNVMSKQHSQTCATFHKSPVTSEVKMTSSKDLKRSKSKNKKRKAFVTAGGIDFEFEPDSNSLKFLSIKTQDFLSKKKRKVPDKWDNFKGPMVVLDGAKENPSRCAVINDPFEKSGAKRANLESKNVTRIEISHLPSDKSVLIPLNEAAESDIWTCALCGKHSSYKFIGDLFGPYTVETMSDDVPESPKDLLGCKKRRSDDSQPSTSKGGCTRRTRVIREASEWKEVWIHESCAIYSDGVFLIGSKLYGLQEAVRVASQTLCTLCQEKGAMIGCLNKGCQQKFHHACAQEAECYLDEENFSMLCPKHKIKKLKLLEDSAAMGSIG